MTYAPHAPRGSLSRPPGAWHPGADASRGADLRLLGERGTKIMTWAMPLTLGLVYGYWAAANTRDGGSITGWNLFYGFVTALVFMLALMGMRALAPRLSRGIRAVAWGAFTGVALGYLVSTTATSVIRSLVMGAALGVGVFVSVLYRTQTRRTPGSPRPDEASYPVPPREDEARTAAYASRSYPAPGTPATPGSAGGPAGGTVTAAEPAAPELPVRHGTLRRRRRGGKVRLAMRTFQVARAMRRRH